MFLLRVRKHTAIISLFFSLSLISQNVKVRHGDLLFQYINCGSLCEAINKVTPAYQGRHYNHVGIVIKTDSGFRVLEAIGKEVCLTSVEKFILRSGKYNILVAQVPLKYRYYLSYWKNYLNYPYDTVFQLNNGAFYCSELAYELFRDKKGKSFFHLYPMTFKDPVTQKFDSNWVRYFEKMNLPIPEGEYGLNPGSMLNEKKIKIKKL